MTVGSGVSVCLGAGNAPICYVGLDLRTGIVVSNTNTTYNTLVFGEPHRFKTGDRFIMSGTTAWGGLSNDTDYYVYLIDEFTIRVCSSKNNAYAVTPVFITLTAAAGTSTVSSRQFVGISQPPGLLVFENPTFQGGSTGIEVQCASHVLLYTPHVENTAIAIKASTSSNNAATVSVIGGSFANAAQGAGAGCLFDASAGGGTIDISVAPDIVGITDLIASGNTGSNLGVRPPRSGWLGGYYPTTGAGISGKMLPYYQLGNSAEIDIFQGVNREYLLNTGTTSIQYIKAQAQPGDRVTFSVFTTTGSWLEFNSNGNIDLLGKNYLVGSTGNTLRIPAGSFLSFCATGLNQGWRLDRLELPVHSASWILGGSISANNSVSYTVACPGARVGDISPSISLSTVLTAGLCIVAEVTAIDTVTVRIINTTTSVLVLPNNPTIYTRQNR